jgi:hypothetical protein
MAQAVCIRPNSKEGWGLARNNAHKICGEQSGAGRKFYSENSEILSKFCLQIY